METQPIPEATAAKLTWPQQCDLIDDVALHDTHPTWTILGHGVTIKGLVTTGCLVSRDGSYHVTDHGRAVVAILRSRG